MDLISEFSGNKCDVEVDYNIKIIVVGNTGAGKTSLIGTFVKTDFEMESTKSTVGLDFALLTLEDREHGKIKLNIWDTGGQERFASIIDAYYRNSDGILIVYDVTDKDSFEKVSMWYERVRVHLQHNNAYKIIIVANKIDLLLNESTRGDNISKEERMGLTDSYNLPYVQVSVKSGEPHEIQGPFIHLIQSILKDKELNAIVRKKAEQFNASIKRNKTRPSGNSGGGGEEECSC